MLLLKLHDTTLTTWLVQFVSEYLNTPSQTVSHKADSNCVGDLSCTTHTVRVKIHV